MAELDGEGPVETEAFAHGLTVGHGGIGPIILATGSPMKRNIEKR